MNEPRKLESLTLDTFWELFLLSCPPPAGMPPEAVASYKWFYAAGLGCATVLLERLEKEPSERRTAIIAAIAKQCCDATGVKLNG